MRIFKASSLVKTFISLRLRSGILRKGIDVKTVWCGKRNHWDSRGMDNAFFRYQVCLQSGSGIMSPCWSNLMGVMSSTPCVTWIDIGKSTKATRYTGLFSQAKLVIQLLVAQSYYWALYWQIMVIQWWFIKIYNLIQNVNFNPNQWLSFSERQEVGATINDVIQYYVTAVICYLTCILP